MNEAAASPAASEAEPTPLRVLVLPPNAWGPHRRNHVPGDAPDTFGLFDLLRADGIDCTIIDPHGRPWNPFAGRSSLLEALDPWRALRVLLRERGADLVLCVFEGPAAPLLLLRRLLRFRVPIALWDIGLTENWRLRERLLDLVVPRVDAILVLGQSQVPYIRLRWPKAPPVAVVHHRVDATFFRPAPPNPLGPVVSIGDDAGRDFATLAAAARGIDRSVVVKTRRPAAEFGSPPPANITLLGGWLSYLDIRRLYEDAGVVVVPLGPTLNASGVSSILEAMAMQRPLVVSRSEAIGDFIVPGETCLAVPCGDADGLRCAVAELIDDPEKAARLAHNGRRLIEDRFTDQIFSRTLASELRRIFAAARSTQQL